MVKTQVQIPESLYRRAKQIAQAREFSLAEVMRRGLEYMSRSHPPVGDGRTELSSISADWFVEGFDQLDFRRLAVDDEVRSSQ